MAEKAVSSDNWLKMKSFPKEKGSNRLLRAQTLTVSFKKPFDLLAETTLAVRSTTAVSEQCSRWWRRRELNSTGKKNNFSLSCVVRHKVGVNKGGRAYFVFLSLAGHHAPQRMK